MLQLELKLELGQCVLHDGYTTGQERRADRFEWRLNKNKISPRPNAMLVPFVVVVVVAPLVIPLTLVALNYSRLATKTRTRGATDALMLNLPNKRFVCNFAIVAPREDTTARVRARARDRARAW